MLKNRPAILLILVMVIGLVLPPDVEAFNNLPAGFSDQLVISNVPSPTAIAWLPGGQMLVTGQGGMVYRQNGSGAVPILDLTGQICSGVEMGLLGLAVDPQYAAGQSYIYVYYTHKKSSGGCDADNRSNRLSRILLNASLVPGPEQVLLDNISAKGGNHNGGDVQFGKDGLLYVSVGDAGSDILNGNGQNGNANARRLSLLNGKILRIAPDGAVPASNPFTGAGSTSCATTGQAPVVREDGQAEKKKKKRKGKKGKHKNSNNKKKHKRKRKRNQDQQQPPPGQQPAPPSVNPPTGNESICQEIFVTGLRNPYRIAFDPDGTAGNQRLNINDVGGGAWEEIDQAIAGADYGWNIREGPCPTGTSGSCSPDGRFTEPIFAYPHSTGCRTITGGAFVPNSSGWPATYLEAYLYADFICDQIFALRGETTGQPLEVFGTGTGATHLAFGPDNALYYTTFDGGGQVRRIVYQP